MALKEEGIGLSACELILPLVQAGMLSSGRGFVKRGLPLGERGARLLLQLS